MVGAARCAGFTLAELQAFSAQVLGRSLDKSSFRRKLDARGIVKGDRVVIWGANGHEWIAAFFNQCEIMGIKKVSEIMSGKRRWIRSDDRFEKSCELILYKRLTLLAVVDEDSKPVGVITRRMVLREIGARMFK